MGWHIAHVAGRHSGPAKPDVPDSHAASLFDETVAGSPAYEPTLAAPRRLSGGGGI